MIKPFANARILAMEGPRVLSASCGCARDVGGMANWAEMNAKRL